MQNQLKNKARGLLFLAIGLSCGISTRVDAVRKDHSRDSHVSKLGGTVFTAVGESGMKLAATAREIEEAWTVPPLRSSKDGDHILERVVYSIIKKRRENRNEPSIADVAISADEKERVVADLSSLASHLNTVRGKIKSADMSQAPIRKLVRDLVDPAKHNMTVASDDTARLLDWEGFPARTPFVVTMTNDELIEFARTVYNVAANELPKTRDDSGKHTRLALFQYHASIEILRGRGEKPKINYSALERELGLSNGRIASRKKIADQKLKIYDRGNIGVNLSDLTNEARIPAAINAIFYEIGRRGLDLAIVKEAGKDIFNPAVAADH